MNNDQFRRLALGVGQSNGKKNDANKAAPTPHSSSALGSRQRASIPMTPRSGGGSSRIDLARQMAERFQDPNKQKKFRTSKPKGSRLAEGYVDRAKTRTKEEDEEDERAARLAALEESYKKQEIDQTTYEKLRFEIAGGDLSSTHLVKGLDFKLLDRVRKGEDVFEEKKEPKEGDDEDDVAEAADAATGANSVEDEFDRLEESEVHAVTHEKTKKKGQLATTALAPGKKRTRDQILAELKAAREAAKKQQDSALGSRFKKIGASTHKPGTSRIERDGQGREVLIIVDEDGHEKRKVRKLAGAARGSDHTEEHQREALAPAKDAKVLGMEVPEFYKKKLEAEAAAEATKEVNIFDDVEDDYDPLAGMDSDSDSDSDQSEAEGDKKKAQEKAQARDKDARSDKEEGEASDASEEDRPKPKESKESKESMAPPQPRRNYFQDSSSKLLSEEAERKGPSFDDPSVMAALRKAKAMREKAESEEKTKETEREDRLKKLLQNSDRDAEDLDMGFGSNRLDDDDDEGDDGIKLSNWGEDDGGDGGQARGGKAKRKRGPKKRKGDGNSAADVMRVLEKRQQQ